VVTLDAPVGLRRFSPGRNGEFQGIGGAEEGLKLGRRGKERITGTGTLAHEQTTSST